MRIAVYAGTFDPITCGHLSVIERSSQLFDRLWVVLAINPSKTPLFSIDERIHMIREVIEWPNVECASTHGFIVHFAQEKGARYLVRGVRTCTDVEDEIRLANINHTLAPDIETVFVPAHPSLSEVSSSKLKELARAGRDISLYCPGVIGERPCSHALCCACSATRQVTRKDAADSLSRWIRNE